MSLAIEHLLDAFQWTWQTSAQASLFVGLVLLVLFIWGHHLSPHWRMAFGLLVLARLMIPVLPESSFSYLNLLPSDPSPAAEPGRSAEPPHIHSSHSRPTPSIKPTTSPSLLAGTVPAITVVPPISGSSPTDIQGISHQSQEKNKPGTSKLFSVGGLVIWLLGMLFLISGTLIRRNILLRKIKNLPPLPEHSITGNLQRQCLAELNFSRSIPVVECDQIETATVFGFLRPVILVSPQLEKNFSSQEIRNILLHELAHIRHADILWNWLAFAVQTVHWFNPLVYLATRRFRSDRELACDARVLKCLSDDEHKQYGNTLIKISEISTGVPLQMNPALAPFFHRKSEIRNRITMIAKPNKTSKLAHIALATLLGLVLSVAFTSAADDQPERRRDTPKQRKERSSKAECADCEKTQKDKPSSRENKQRDPQPKRTERRGRPPHPPEGRGPQDMPPEARKFAERVRGFHQEIGNLHRKGNSEAARDVQAELHEFIKDHAELARRADPAIRGPGGRPGRGREPENDKPGRRPQSPEADMEHVGDELRKAKKDGRHEDAERLRRHLEEMQQHHAERPGRPEEEIHEMERRIHHLDQAAENLEQAGMHDQARQLYQQVERLEHENLQREREHLQREREGEHARGERGREDGLERELQERTKQMDRKMREHAEQMDNELHKLGNVIERLKKENEQLKKELRKRKGGE